MSDFSDTPPKAASKAPPPIGLRMDDETPRAWQFTYNLSDAEVQEDVWEIAFADWVAAPEVLPLVMRRERYEKELVAKHGSHHHVDFYALYVVAGGHGTHIVNGEPFGMARGDIYFLAPGAIHDYRVPDFVEVDALYFRHDLFSSTQKAAFDDEGGLASLLDSQRSGAMRRLHLSPTRHAAVLQNIFEMRRDLDAGSPLVLEIARAAFFALLGRLILWSRAAAKVSASVPIRRRVNAQVGLERVLAFCEERFHEPLSIAQMSALMHLSSGHFSEVFTREMGMAPTIYLRQIRLERAQNLLRSTRNSVGEIASLSGFGSSAFFSRAFRQAFNTTPLEYRRAHAKKYQR